MSKQRRIKVHPTTIKRDREMADLAKRYFCEHGNMLVKRTNVDEDDPYSRLGGWIKRLRERYQKACDTDRHDNIVYLESLASTMPGFLFEPDACDDMRELRAEKAYDIAYRDKWMKEYECLKSKMAQGDPVKTATSGHGRWIALQRNRRNNGKLPAWQERLLDEISFPWSS